MQEFDRQLRETSVADWQTYLRSRVLDSAAPSLSDDFVKAEFAFREEFLNGAREMKPRWKRCAEATDSLLGEALGRKYVEKYFPPQAKARMLELVKNLQLAMKETIEGLEWMGPQTKARALEKLSTFNPKIGYPDKWKDYSSVAVRTRRVLGVGARGAPLRPAGRSRADQQANRSRPLAPDAADLGRVLQPDAERDRVPRRHPAAAGVQRGERRCDQLRRDRRRDRPRDQSRLRRPGRAVRRAGPAEELVDADAT